LAATVCGSQRVRPDERHPAAAVEWGTVADRSEFDAFVVARSPALLRTAYLLTHDRAAAEDLVQVALTRAWVAWGRVGADPGPYVRKVLVNAHTSAWRRRWRGELPSAQLPESSASATDTTDVVDERDAVWTALGRLPRRQRAVVVLRYFEDLTEAQTAALLGVSVGTVKSQTSKALARLRVDTTLAPAPVREET
jgi:RNA polymerase sigma-70 factor (sigma-E family)